MQGPISGIAAALLPMARIAPAVDPNDLSVDKQVSCPPLIGSRGETTAQVEWHPTTAT